MITNKAPHFNIRTATPEDSETLVKLIAELGEFERLTDQVISDPENLKEHLSGNGTGKCEALIAEIDTEAVGFALFFQNYSTFLTRWGIYLEDIYVKPEYRGEGIGYSLLTRITEIAVERGCKRVEWAVLKWNEAAISFYEKLGAKQMSEWTIMRLSGDSLAKMGTKEEGAGRSETFN